MSGETIDSMETPERRWQAWTYGHFGGVPDMTNVSILSFVHPDVHHKVHEHWHQFSPPNPFWHPVLGTLYFIIGLVALGGNGLVMWIFAMTRTLRSGTNYLMINLALTDLLMMLSQFPVLIANCFNQTWTLGPLACEIYGFCGALFGTVSIINMALIAYDRYRAIVTPFAGRRLSKGRALMWILGAWVYSAVWCSFPFLGWNRYVLEGFMISCSFDYLSGDIWSRLYVFALFMAAYALPLGVIAWCYVLIVLSVNKHDEDIVNHERAQGEGIRYANLHKRETQLAKVVFTSVFFWVLAWTPYAVVSLLGLFSWHSLLTPLATMLPALFAKMSTVYNPFIYAVSHPRYRQEVGRRLPWLCCVMPSPAAHATSSMRSSTKSDVSTLPFLSRSASLVSSRNEKAQADLPSPTTLMHDMAEKIPSLSAAFDRQMIH
ncbi:rhodopsin-like [Palaemon carinicauda]|uniref:rhodopsin-like n=1 Tax=Palaemon carinicauda TaxID=392227 RepID=UPI0035B59132